MTQTTNEAVEAVVAGKRLVIKPGAPEIALLCRAIFRSTFADDEDEALVNEKYNEWPDDAAKAIRAAKFVLRALGGNGSVLAALRTPTQPSDGDVERAARMTCEWDGSDPDEIMPDHEPRWKDRAECMAYVLAALSASTPPGADTIEALQARVAELEGALESANRVIDFAAERLWNCRPDAIASRPAAIDRDLRRARSILKDNTNGQ